MTTHRTLSVVIPVQQERPDIGTLHASYKKALEPTGYALQFIYVVDGPFKQSLEALRQLKRAGESLEILGHGQSFGEATALSTGFRYARGELVMTLGDVQQVQGYELAKLIEEATEADVVVARRSPPDGVGPGGQRKFEYFVRLVLGSEFSDLRCSVRVLSRSVIEEITLYGNQHHFLPLIAQTHGFTVDQIDVDALRQNRRSSSGPKFDLILDVITAYFLIRFVRKPFRFFGGFGFAILAFGGAITAYLVFLRLFFDVALIDRPALILSSLMVVLGIQIISVGLIGEIITFAFTKEHKDYKVERIVE